MSKSDFVLVKLVLVSASQKDTRCWAGAYEAVSVSSQTCYFYGKKASPVFDKEDSINHYNTVPAWYWGRVAEHKLLAVGDEFDGWVELTEDEFIQFKQELSQHENLPS